MNKETLLYYDANSEINLTLMNERRTIMFKDWNYKKHVKFVSGIYLALWTIDMTLGYLVVKKYSEKLEKQ